MVSGPLTQDFRNTWVERVVVQGFRTTCRRFQEHVTCICGCARFRDNLHKISWTLDLKVWLYKVSGPPVQDFRNMLLAFVVVQGSGTTCTRFQEHLIWMSFSTRFLGRLYKISVGMVVVHCFRTTYTRFQEHLSWKSGCTRFWDNLDKISGTLDLN